MKENWDKNKLKVPVYTIHLNRVGVIKFQRFYEQNKSCAHDTKTYVIYK